MTLGNGWKCERQMTFLDVDGTHEIGDGYDMSDYSVNSDTLSDARYLLEKFARDGGMRVVIEKSLDGWITLFHETRQNQLLLRKHYLNPIDKGCSSMTARFEPTSHTFIMSTARCYC